MAAMHILLIEDDLDLGQPLLQALQQGGFTVQWLRSVAATPPLPDANEVAAVLLDLTCLLYTSPSPRDQRGSRMPSSA